jgi:hypothetical protein
MRASNWCAITIVGAALAACSASGQGSSSFENTGGATSTAAGPGPGSGAGNPSGSGVGGSTGVFSGAGVGSGASDAGVSDVNLGDGACEAIGQQAQSELQPADIIFAIDTSGSMTEETNFVIQQMNNFSQQIIASGIDVRVIMLAEYPVCIFTICTPGICLLPPLGAQNGCTTTPLNDSNLPTYFHHPTASVGSTDGLNVFINTYNDWKMYLRPNSTKTLVVVTDDDATSPPNNNATTFINNFKALDPALLGNFKMSGIYCFTNCPSSANVGNIWKDIITQTGGIHGDLCLQNFQPVFDDLATQIITGSQTLDCQWTIPPPPAGQTFDPTKVNVKFTDSNGMQKDIFYASSQAACDPVNGGWYYDNNANPTTIYACPASCTEIQSATTGKIDILFGCATVSLPPPT